MAVGWDPTKFSLSDPLGDTGWSYARRCLSQLKPGDEVIPYLRNWRVGPVGTISSIRVADNDWYPTVPDGADIVTPIDDRLGRRIEVEWWTSQVPHEGMIAVVPSKLQGECFPNHAIEPLTPDLFQTLINVFKGPGNWQVVEMDP